jgi:dGTPase
MEHAIQVASISRNIARCLGLNEDLTEAIGLGHDLGHAPFGHHGETGLSKICAKNGLPPFEHEVNGLRVVDRLAQIDRHEEPGLALTFETRDGIISHNGEDRNASKIVMNAATKDLKAINQKSDAGFPCTLEGCIVRLVDKIAYSGRDLEDGIVHAKIIKDTDIPDIVTEVLGSTNGQITGTLVKDIIENSPIDANFISLSPTKAKALSALITFNYDSIYRSPELWDRRPHIWFTMKRLFNEFLEIIKQSERFKNLDKVSYYKNFTTLKVFRDFFSELSYDDNDRDEQIVIDYLSGFTDNFVRFAINEIYQVPRSEVL